MRASSLTALILVMGLLVGACGGASAAPPSEPEAVDAAQATTIASSAFAAFNAGDYAGWSRDWSTTMKTAIPEDAFQAWRTTAIEQLGSFVSLGTPTRTSKQPGTYRWSFPVTFERGAASVGFAFFDGHAEVEGVFVE